MLTVPLLCGQSTVVEDYARAWLLAGQGNSDEAIPILQSIIVRAPACHPAYAKLTDAYLQKHAPEHAEAYFANLLGDPERSAFAHYALGQIAGLALRWSQAVDHYAACVQQRPDSVPCYVPLVYSLMNATRRSATLEDLASRIPGNREGSYSCLGFTRFLLAQRKVGEGLQAAQRCLARAETLGQIDFLAAAHDVMAEAFAATGANSDPRLLQQHLEADRLAAQLDDPEAAFSHNLAVCIDYASLDRDAEAQECFGRALTAARSQGHRSWLENSLIGTAQADKRRGTGHGPIPGSHAQFSAVFGV